MSKTYRDSWASAHIIHRCPHGKKKALVNEVRYGAIPPDAREDKRISRECQQVWIVARKLAKEGYDKAAIIKRLKDRFGMEHKDASYVAGYAEKWYH